MGRGRRQDKDEGGGSKGRGIEVAWMAVNPEDEDRISRKQLLDAVHFLGLNPTKKVMRNFAAEAGGGNELYTMEDLRTLANSIPPTTADDLVQAFQLIDENGDGSLSRKELEDALMHFGERMTRTELEEVMTFDTDQSGSIEYKEFCDMCMTFAEQITAMQPPDDDDSASVSSSFTASTTYNDDSVGGKPKSEKRPGNGRSSSAISSARRSKSSKTTKEKKREGKTRDRDTTKAQKLKRKTSRDSQTRNSRASSSHKDDRRRPDRGASSRPSARSRRTKTGTNTKEARASDSDDSGSSAGEEATSTSTTKRPAESTLKTWARWELHGRLQAQKEGAPTSQFFELKPTKATQLLVDIALEPAQTAPQRKLQTRDVSCVLLDAEERSPIAIAERVEEEGRHMLLADVEPGAYILAPVAIPPGSLKCRDTDKAAKAKLAQLCVTDANDAKSFTEAATTALDEAFRSFDTRRNGRLSRSEYNALLKQTDGEECEDDVWEFILENFDAEDGELTRRGFFQIYTQMVADEESDEDIYPHFEHLGFNRKLQLDEVVLWNITCYVSKPGAVPDVELKAFDPAVAEAATKAAKEP